ncbi:MAG: DciA family protein [Casimicrobiaceae bacterium]
MKPRKLERIVNDDPALAVLWNQTRPLRELQILYETLVPTYLRSASRVGSVIRDELKLFTDSGAVATRIRLLAPDLLAEFRAKGWQFSAIRVAVQVRIPPDAPRKIAREPFDAKAREAFSKVAEGLSESPLKDAMKRLANKR